MKGLSEKFISKHGNDPLGLKFTLNDLSELLGLELSSRRATDLVCIWKGFGWITPTGRSKKNAVYEWVGISKTHKKSKVDVKKISSMEGYAEHYSHELSTGGEPYRMEACKRRYYDAKNVWQSFKGELEPPKMVQTTLTLEAFTGGRKRARPIDTDEEIQSSYDPREFRSCFFTSLIDRVSLNDSDTRDAFDL